MTKKLNAPAIAIAVTSEVHLQNIFLTAIWLPLDQLWTIIEEAPSLTQC